MKLISTTGLILIGFFFAQHAAGQATEELLHSKTVENFLVFKVDASQKTMGYFIDKDTESRNMKQVRGKTCFALAEKAEEKQVRLELAYLNPFKYKITIADTSLTDPTFENVSKFLEQVQAVTGQLATGGAAGGLTIPILKASTPTKTDIAVE